MPTLTTVLKGLWPRHWSRRPRPIRRVNPLLLELLEDRTAPAGNTLATADLVVLGPVNQPTVVQEALSQPNEVDLYRVTLAAGDRLQVAVQAYSTSGLD